MKKVKLFVTAFFLLFPVFLLAQTWREIIQLNPVVDFEDRIDLHTNRDGNHFIVQTSDQLVYYLVTYCGTPVRSVIIENNIDEHPRLSVITGYQDKVYVIYKKGDCIHSKRTRDGGQNWENLDNITLGSASSNGLEAWPDEDKIHLVWSELQYTSSETYYFFADHDNTYWQVGRQVTDWPEETGGFPSVTSSANRVHVAYTSGADGLIGNREISKVRDCYYSTWLGPQLLFDDAARAYVIADENLLHTFYYAFDAHMGQFWYDLYHKTRSLGGTSWSTPVRLEQYDGNPRDCPVDMAISANNNLHIAYSGNKYRIWTSSGWGSEERYSESYYDDCFNQKISANSDDIYVIWIDDQSIKLRQRDYPPLAPVNMNIADVINNHPKLSWNANQEADLDGYKVYRKIPGTDNDFVLLATTTDTFYVDQGNILDYKFGEDIYYRVKAADHYDNLSDYSNTVNAKGYVGVPGQLSRGALNQKAVATIPDRVLLYANYPNPFNPATTISFALPDNMSVNLSIYSVSGQRIRTLVQESCEKGSHRVNWDGKDENGLKVSSGIYLYELIAGNARIVKKMLLTK